MKPFIKLLLFVLILGLAGPFVLKRPDGRPWMQLSDVVPGIEQVGNKLSGWWASVRRGAEAVVSEAGQDGGISANGASEREGTTVYRWRDQHGNVFYSDEPHPDGQHEVVVLEPNHSVVPATKPATQEPTADKAAQNGGFTVPLPLTVSPQDASQLMEDAEAARRLMENRQQAVDEAIERSQ